VCRIRVEGRKEDAKEKGARRMERIKVKKINKEEGVVEEDMK
jgi:hypothetical protein